MIRLGLLLVIASTLALGVAEASGCNGQLSLGNPLASIDAGAVQASTIEQCSKAGFQHPNVCCTGSQYVASACGTYPMDPFAPCPGSFLTFPNPNLCCPLDPTQGPCNEVMASRVAPDETCVFACPPGEFQSDSGACCWSNGSSGVCSAGSAATVALPCNQPACLVGDECPLTCNPTAPCGACPSGFTTPDAAPTLCCRDGGLEDGGLGPQCFSQAVGSASSIGSGTGTSSGGSSSVVDASISVPPSLDAGGTPSPTEAGVLNSVPDSSLD